MKLWFSARIATICASSLVIAATLPPGTKVHFATCTLPGVEHGCVMAHSGGALFNVTGAKPGLRPYQWLQGTATATDKVSYCMQGQVVENFVPDNPQELIGCVHLPAIKRRR